MKKGRRFWQKISVYLWIILLLFLASLASIARQFIGLNASVEYERSVFISQIAEQMRHNVVNSREDHLELVRSTVAMLSKFQPRSFDEVCSLFPDYTENDSVNRFFLLSSQCELYGVDGAKQWVSLPYDEYLLDALSEESTTDFIRIGMDQEYMVYSIQLPTPLTLDGTEISAVFYAWNSSEYRATLSSRLFEEKSSSLLIGRDGNIAIYPEDQDSETYGYNIYTYLVSQGIDQNSLTALQDYITGSDDTTVLCDVAGSRWLFKVAPYSSQYSILIMLPIQVTSAGTYGHLFGLLTSLIASLLLLFLMIGCILLSVYRRQRAQRELNMRTELLMKTAEAKNEFLAKMSHDIRTPLNGIIGMNYIAATKVPPENTELAQCLHKVNSSAKYLLGILNDILDMNKIESGKMELSVSPFSIARLKADIEPIVLTQLDGKNIRFQIDSQNIDDCSYLGDELRIKQILMNLLSNAVKFTLEGSVSLRIERRPLDEATDEVVFTVTDTGKGIDEAYLENIFSPFTQEDSGITASYGGSGLGLSIVKSFVDLMGGSISVTSVPDSGSEFVVNLPLKKAASDPSSDEAKKDAAADYDFSGYRILLCEDNELNAEIATAIFKQIGLQVDWASNGKEGVERFAQAMPGTYDMIFMDVRMPEMDGYEATRSIRALKRPDAETIPICALSANAFAEDMRQSLAAGMNEHLAKPLEIDSLISVLHKYLQKKIRKDDDTNGQINP